MVIIKRNNPCNIKLRHSNIAMEFNCRHPQIIIVISTLFNSIVAIIKRMNNFSIKTQPWNRRTVLIFYQKTLITSISAKLLTILVYIPLIQLNIMRIIEIILLFGNYLTITIKVMSYKRSQPQHMSHNNKLLKNKFPIIKISIKYTKVYWTQLLVLRGTSWN